MEQKRAGGKTLAADAYTAIRQTIRSGTFKPGDRLRFADLQALCGMSVTPVREALARLTAEGFTVLDDHRGYSVASLSLEELRDITLFQEHARLSTVSAYGADQDLRRLVHVVHERRRAGEALVADQFLGVKRAVRLTVDDVPLARDVSERVVDRHL